MTIKKNTTFDSADFRLDDQVGFLLRKASQRNLSFFSTYITGPTPMQFATIAKLAEKGALSQNALGRLTAMDAATIKGVVDRLKKSDLVKTEKDKTDRRRTIVALTQKGKQCFENLSKYSIDICEDTLRPLSSSDKAEFLRLLRKLT